MVVVVEVEEERQEGRPNFATTLRAKASASREGGGGGGYTSMRSVVYKIYDVQRPSAVPCLH